MKSKMRVLLDHILCGSIEIEILDMLWNVESKYYL